MNAFHIGVGLLVIGVIVKYFDDSAQTFATLDAKLPNGLDVPTVVLLTGGAFLAYGAYRHQVRV